MLIDLSVALNEQTPIYPGDPATKIEPAGVLAKDGYTDHYVSIGTHVGTHIDAPMHMLDDGKSLDQISLERFVGQGRLIKVTDNGFNELKAAGIKEGDIVLLCTGMSDKYQDSVYFEDYPAMSEEAAKYLVDAKVKMVGVDACSVDNQEGFPIHKILLAGGVLIIENLTKLNLLDDKNFTVYALPIKLQIDGAPARVIAEIKE
jgi:kynurenine formamidase